MGLSFGVLSAVSIGLVRQPTGYAKVLLVIVKFMFFGRAVRRGSHASTYLRNS